MHDVLEGVLQYEAKLLLQYCVGGKKFFKLKDLNQLIEGLEMGYMEASSRPAPIPQHALNSSDHLLKQNGNSYHILQYYNTAIT